LLRFFGDHERCGAGFEFRRPEGPGGERLSVRCKGCGGEMEYSSAAQAGVVGAPRAGKKRSGGSLGSRLRRAARRLPRAPRIPKLPRREAPASSSPAAPVELSGPARLERLRQGAGANLITGGLVLLAGACAVFAVVRLNSSSDNAPAPRAQTPTATITAAPAPAPATPPPAPTRHQTLQAAGPEAKREAVASGGPTIAVPDGWSRSSTADGAIVFEPRAGSGVAVEIYYQRSSSLSPEEMRKLAHSVLERDHPGARMESAPPLAGAFQEGWVALYGEGRERAQGMFQRGLGVLLLVRTDRSAAERQRAAALATADSLRLS
jgi:hypothetical protein